ncbi:hypothetical protein EQ718_04600 [Paracoccus versutus]|jgi:hypothetical protein|uniref:Uncharacterized protein n=1 Tax=Paracoccus versutus TaxID=34007 RepID=A0A099FD50_PARVE|nr:MULTISPECIES: hypothetical protein [Paracoccus]WGR60888.1 hypothetical protein E3U26_09345 [Paracoccus ferrooxidans]SFY42908.1 hypothetical protein SAMN04244548_04558 [Paracoccus pantotrophus]KGJ08163.1 hypothetical protein IT40_19090 [Paracoccus versutus]MBT0780036.1 hypothetical protein [Paracoccus sp. pheM1]MCJ1900802.1 hypothetical protein [Paracoccus versutus]
MTRHIADRSHENSSGRTQYYTRQERESGLHPAIAALRMRPRVRSSEEANRRAAEFARIERGHRV